MFLYTIASVYERCAHPCVHVCAHTYTYVHIHGGFIENGVKWMRLTMYIENRKHIISWRDGMGRNDDRFIGEKDGCKEIGRQRMEEWEWEHIPAWWAMQRKKINLTFPL